MPRLKSRFTMLVATTAIGFGGLAAPIALAGDYCPEPPAKKKCNAGRGNGSEGCDPGNSSTSSGGNTGQNQGGDEGGPIQGGTGAP
ncbi:MAG: hypothetical protein AABM66_14600 [Actinomycetota bacterium]